MILNNALYKQIDGVTMESPLGPSEPSGLRSVDHIFVVFKSSDHLKRFHCYLNSCHAHMLFTIEIEQNNKISILDVNVIR